MGMDPRCGDYLTGTNTSCHPDRARMAFFLHRLNDFTGKKISITGKKMTNKQQKPFNINRLRNTVAKHQSGAVDIVELIRTTRTDIEKMIAEIRKSHPAPLKSTAQKETDLEILTGNIAHTFSNIFMAIQGRISLMLLRSGPEHAFFTQLKRLEKLVQSESILAHDILPHITGRFCPLDRFNRQQLLDQITQIPLLLGVKTRSAGEIRSCALNSESDPIDSYKLIVSATCILNLLLSEIRQLTDFMMTQTASKHPDFFHLHGIKAYVQKGFDGLRDLYEWSGLAAKDCAPTQPQKLVEIAFDAFFQMDSSLCLHISVADNLWFIKADFTQIKKIIEGLYTAAATAISGGDDLLFTADNACGTVRNVDGDNDEGYVVLTIGSAAQQARPCAKSKKRTKCRTIRKKISENDLGLVGVSGMIRSLGGRLSTICPPAAGVAFNIFMPAFRQAVNAENTRKSSNRSKRVTRVIYLNPDGKAMTSQDRIEHCMGLYQPGPDKSVRSSN